MQRVAKLSKQYITWPLLDLDVAHPPVVNMEVCPHIILMIYISRWRLFGSPATPPLPSLAQASSPRSSIITDSPGTQFSNISPPQPTHINRMPTRWM